MADAALARRVSNVNINKHQPVRARRVKITPYRVYLFFRRVAIIAAALLYIISSIQSSLASLHVLRGSKNAPMRFEAYETSNMIKYVGKGLMSESPLMYQLMQNDTSPRNYSMYLESDGTVSVTGCSSPTFNRGVYGNFFLRLGFGSLIRDTMFNFTDLVMYQMLMPIVDCSFTPIVRGDGTLMRMYYVMRNRMKPTEIALFAVRFNMQNYIGKDRHDEGPVGLATYTYITDMRTTTLKYKFAGAVGYPFEVAKFYVYTLEGMTDDGWWSLLSVPPNPLVDAPHRMTTASRTGFYIGSDSEQSNIKNLHWSMDDTTESALTKWNWKGEPVLKDSWAWVHFLHTYFAVDALFNLLVLALVMYRNLQRGKIWIGDAFVSISSTLLLRGAMILISWVINGFWSLMEFCLHDAHKLAGTQEIFFFPEIMHADLLTIHLAVSTILGYIFRERIDPIVAVVAFEIGFYLRLEIAPRWFPSVLETITDYAKADQKLAVVAVSKTVAYSAPLRLWTTHALPAKDLRFIFSCLMPIFSTAVLILVYVILRKIYRRFRPDTVRVLRSHESGAPDSENGDAGLLHKRNLTLFEIATGAELQSRFGVISDFENYLYIKGMKYASADGIYSNGFLIVSDKVLIATADLPSIVFMKLLRLRVRNVYTYEVTGSTVQQTAKLIYPNTFTWRELTHLNINVLS